MSIVKNIARNSVFLTVSYGISSIFNLFFFAYTTQLLNAEGFGILSIAMAFTGIMGVFNDMGLGTILTREVAKDLDRSKKYLDNILAMKLVLVVLTLVMTLVAAKLLGTTDRTFNIIVIIAIANVALTFSAVLNSLFQAYERMEYQAFGGILSSGLMLLGGIYATYNHFDIVQFSLIYVVVNLVVLAYSFFVCVRKFVFPGLQLDWTLCRRIAKDTWPIGVVALSLIIYSRTSTLMLGYLKGDVASGLYSAAFRLSDMTTMVAVIFTTSVFPIISRFHKDSRDSFLYAYEKSFKYLLALALPMALVVTVLALPIILLINKKDFADSSVALQILIWSAVAAYLNMVLGNTLVNANLQKLIMRVTILSIVVNVGLNLVLIPLFSYNGAAVSTVITEVFITAFYFYYLNRYGYKIDLSQALVPSVFSFCVAGATVLAMLALGVNVFVVAAMGVSVYSVLMLTIGVKKDDWALIAGLLKR